MYEDIEKFYKSKSNNNKIKRKSICNYSITFLIILIINFCRPNDLSSSLIMYGVTLLLIALSLLVMMEQYEKILNLKLHLNFKKENNKELSLEEIIRIKDKTLFINYLKENKIYNTEAIRCILEHYRMFLTSKPNNDVLGHLLTIITLVVSITLPFITKEYTFDIKGFLMAFIISLIAVVIIVSVYIPFNIIIDIKKNLTGEKNIYSNLENIFSEIYIEYNKKSIKKSKNQNKKIQ